MFSYQRSRRNNIRLQALSFYLQEKKVKVALGAEAFLLVSALSNSSVLCLPVLPREGRHQHGSRSDAAGTTPSGLVPMSQFGFQTLQI